MIAPLCGSLLVNTYEIVIVVVAAVFLTVIVVSVFIASLFGQDLVIFDRYKTAAPKYYRNLKWICRINGPVVALMCVGGIPATPFVAFDPEGGVLLAIATLAGSAMFLWLSVRWFIWSLRA